MKARSAPSARMAAFLSSDLGRSFRIVLAFCLFFQITQIESGRVLNFALKIYFLKWVRLKFALPKTAASRTLAVWGCRGPPRQISRSESISRILDQFYQIFSLRNLPRWRQVSLDFTKRRQIWPRYTKTRATKTKKDP